MSIRLLWQLFDGGPQIGHELGGRRRMNTMEFRKFRENGITRLTAGMTQDLSCGEDDEGQSRKFFGGTHSNRSFIGSRFALEIRRGFEPTIVDDEVVSDPQQRVVQSAGGGADQARV